MDAPVPVNARSEKPSLAAPAATASRSSGWPGGSYLPPAGDSFYRNDMSSQDEFDEPAVICADAGAPGLLYAFIDEKLSARIADSIAEIHRAHGHERFRGNDDKPLSWAVSIKTPLKNALINGFKVIDDISAYEQWIAVLEDAVAFLRSEKPNVKTRSRPRCAQAADMPWRRTFTPGQPSSTARSPNVHVRSFVQRCSKPRRQREC